MARWEHHGHHWGHELLLLGRISIRWHHLWHLRHHPKRLRHIRLHLRKLIRPTAIALASSHLLLVLLHLLGEHVVVHLLVLHLHLLHHHLLLVIKGFCLVWVGDVAGLLWGWHHHLWIIPHWHHSLHHRSVHGSCLLSCDGSLFLLFVGFGVLSRLRPITRLLFFFFFLLFCLLLLLILLGLRSR